MKFTIEDFFNIFDQIRSFSIIDRLGKNVVSISA